MELVMNCFPRNMHALFFGTQRRVILYFIVVYFLVQQPNVGQGLLIR
jgi:hypothetical protein